MFTTLYLVNWDIASIGPDISFVSLAVHSVGIITDYGETLSGSGLPRALVSSGESKVPHGTKATAATTATKICITVKGNQCKFPFRYEGEMFYRYYDLFVRKPERGSVNMCLAVRRAGREGCVPQSSTKISRQLMPSAIAFIAYDHLSSINSSDHLLKDQSNCKHLCHM